MILEWYVGFYNGAIRNHKRRLYPYGWFGHVEIWGYTEHDTWLFFDPQGQGTKIILTHFHDDVMDQLNARHCLCDTILRLPNGMQKPMVPVYPPMTCASIVGHMLGVRAFTPRGLKAKLLAIGAEVIHENAQGRSG